METNRERAQREKEKQEFVASLALREAYRVTFDTPAGRTVLEDMLIKGHALDTTCSGNAWSYFYEGERNALVLRVAAYIPELVGQALTRILAARQTEINKAMVQATAQTQE